MYTMKKILFDFYVGGIKFYRCPYIRTYVRPEIIKVTHFSATTYRNDLVCSFISVSCIVFVTIMEAASQCEFH